MWLTSFAGTGVRQLASLKGLALVGVDTTVESGARSEPHVNAVTTDGTNLGWVGTLKEGRACDKRSGKEEREEGMDGPEVEGTFFTAEAMKR